MSRSGHVCGTAPSTRRHVPDMKAAASESRKTIAAETSDSVPKRLSGTERLSCLILGRAASGYFVSPEEAIQPGATAFTRTPDEAHSTAAVCVKLSIPAPAAPACPMPGLECHISAVMLTIAPPWASIEAR